MNVDTPFRTLAVAACVALGCSIMVASAVYLLRPLQHNDELLARGSVILDAAGRLPADETELLAAYLELDASVVKLGTAELVARDKAHGFDHWQHVQAEDTDAASGRAPVYFVRTGNQLERVVFPVHGPGMWSTIYAYVALAPDLTTIADIVFLRHGETPGIGDRIEAPAWRRAWQGKQLFDQQGTPQLKVVREARTASEVDLISGASVTCEAVGEFVREAFGTDGYGPLVERLRQTGGNP